MKVKLVGTPASQQSGQIQASIHGKAGRAVRNHARPRVVRHTFINRYPSIIPLPPAPTAMEDAAEAALAEEVTEAAVAPEESEERDTVDPVVREDANCPLF